MSKINRRTFSLGSLIGLLMPRATDQVALGNQAPTPALESFGVIQQVPKPSLDPFYKARRIADLQKRLAKLTRNSINMEHKNLDGLRSVSPAVKYLIDHQRHEERQKACYARDLMNELFNLGDKTHGPPDTSGSDHYPSETTRAQASQPY